MGSVLRRCVLVALVALAALAPAAAAHGSFHTRIGTAMGIIPAHGLQETASGTAIPVVFHGGQVMRGVTLHTVFWAPSGFKFNGPPVTGVPGYEQLQQQFLTDVAHDSGSTTNNAFSVLSEYPDATGSGLYNITYTAATDSIDDTDPYPAKSHQCVSPSGIATCVTDLQMQQELDRVIQANDPAGRGFHDIWFVFLPPNVDTCASAGACGTNAFAGYHSLSNLGHGTVIYANIPDPLIEFTPPAGTDPQGNPEAESAIDTIGHEAVEAITDPAGVGWMDPNGFEVGDKCENGPQQGTPLGFATNGSPFNQVINGHDYFMQTMWSNVVQGCVQASASNHSALPLATVNFTQFSPTVTGNIGKAASGISATVGLVRAGTLVALGSGRTDASGGWQATLRGRDGALRGVGDDRDAMIVRYGSGGPAPDLIATGSGGNPFTLSGWTGWYTLDSSYAVGSHSVQVGPCSQVGVLNVVVDGQATAPPIEQCETETDVATLSTKALGPGTSLRMTSQDNRAVSLDNPPGALIALTVPLGEPGSVPSLANSQIMFQTTGFPSCTADLRAQVVACSGLVPGSSYALTRGRGHVVRRTRADDSGAAKFSGFTGSTGIRGGDLLTLQNRAGRVLTRLHVAHLRVDLNANETVVASGRCESGDYYGPPLTDAPVSPAIGVPGVTGQGTICPASGSASRLPINPISQVDDQSGGQTRTEVPLFEGTSPVQNATLYGRFVAVAQTGIPGPNASTINTHTRVSLAITPAAGKQPVFRAAEVGPRGVVVSGLRQGSYLAKWILTDANGDTRTLHTQFVEAR